MRYSIINELGNILNKHVISKIFPGLGQKLHENYMGYHQGLNYNTIKGNESFYQKWGKASRGIQDWSEEKLAPVLGRLGTISLIGGGAVAPAALVGSAVGAKLTKGWKNPQAVKSIKKITSIINVSKKGISRPVGKELAKINKSIFKHDPGAAARAGAIAAGIATIGAPLALGGLLHGARALIKPIRKGSSSLGEWLHSMGNPYRKEVGHQNVYKPIPPKQVKQSYEQYKKNYYQ